ncbi:hypothetical protein EV360DRAFT_80387 [Lentinula raphanica]|nr:hypothetical protein EV360DRAFT_80387 [Lentinula raphanica]
MSLPNELLHSIIEYLAYIPPLPGPRSEVPHRRVSPELVALSVVNRRTRQICLPFLFAYIQINCFQDAERLRKFGTDVLQSFTKTLSLAYLYQRPQEGDQILCQIVPELKRLTHVQLPSCNARSTLLGAVLAHPTVIAVLVNESPPESLYDSDLLKVILEETWMRDTLSKDIERCMDQGMGLKCLELLEPKLLDVEFGLKHFKGLEQLRVSTGFDPICFSWLTELSSTHPSLNELLLKDGRNLYFRRHTPPFISSFIEETRRQGLGEDFKTKYVSLRKAIGKNPQDWHVNSLTISTTLRSSSLIKLLTLISSSFPKLEILILNTEYHKASYRADDLVSTFARFSSLRALYLHRFRKRIAFGCEPERCMPSVDATGFEELLACAERGLLLFTSLLAKQVRSLDSIYIEDLGYEDDKTSTGRRWRLRGWLHVLNGERELVGTLGRSRTLP